MFDVTLRSTVPSFDASEIVYRVAAFIGAVCGRRAFSTSIMFRPRPAARITEGGPTP